MTIPSLHMQLGHARTARTRAQLLLYSKHAAHTTRNFQNVDSVTVDGFEYKALRPLSAVLFGGCLAKTPHRQAPNHQKTSLRVPNSVRPPKTRHSGVLQNSKFAKNSRDHDRNCAKVNEQGGILGLVRTQGKALVCAWMKEIATKSADRMGWHRTKASCRIMLWTKETCRDKQHATNIDKRTSRDTQHATRCGTIIPCNKQVRIMHNERVTGYFPGRTRAEMCVMCVTKVWNFSLKL